MPTFSYQYGANPTIDRPRLLIGDTVEFAADGTTRVYIFADEEIAMAYQIQASAFQSSQFYSFGAGATLPSSPVSVLRVAALLLDSIASTQSRLAGVSKLLDVTLDLGATASACRKQAQQWREVDDESGAFFIIEQCTTEANFISRFYKQVQRQSAQ